MPGPLSSLSGSVVSNTKVPGTKSNTTVRVTCAVAPSAAVATTFSTVVPPVTGTSTEKEPSASAVVVTEVVDELWSVLVARTSTVLPGAVVPVTVTGEPEIDERSAGAVTVSVVWPWVCVT